MMASRPAFIELRIQPSVELISIVRRFVTAFYDEIVHDADATSRIALATHELLENAAKYSIDNETTLSIEITRRGKESVATVRIRNRAKDSDIENLKHLFREMHAESDPLVFYQKMMRANAHRRDGSGLGLARIRAEGEMQLRYELDDGLVTILAEAPLASPASTPTPPPSRGYGS